MPGFNHGSDAIKDDGINKMTCKSNRSSNNPAIAYLSDIAK